MTLLFSPPPLLPGSLWYLLGIVLLADIIRRVQRWYRLRHVPGPVLAGWTSLWATKRHLKDIYFDDISDLVENYGPLIRIAPDKVMCVDVDTIHRISGVRSNYRKSEWYRNARMSRHEDNLFSFTDPVLHKERKKYVVPGYSGKGTAPFEEGTDRALAAWIDLIERAYISTPWKVTYMDFEEKPEFYALDAIGEMAWSDPLGFLKHDRDVKQVLAIGETTAHLMAALGDYLTFWRTIRKWPFYYLLPNDGSEMGFGTYVGNAKKIVTKRLGPNAERKHDMLQSFLDHGLGGDEVIQEVAFQFVAGGETVSTVITLAFYLLLTHPTAYTRLQSEIDAAITTTTAGPAAEPFILPNAQARTLPYLQGVIREVLRLFPPLCGAPFYKEVPPEGDMLCGQTVPGGTLVATGPSQWHIGRDRTFWGPDADCFRPERWLEAEAAAEAEAEAEKGGTPGKGAAAERLAQMTRRVEMVFGSGQFICVGRAIGLMEAGKVIGELVRRYNWSLANPLSPPKVLNVGVWVLRDFWVKVERR